MASNYSEEGRSASEDGDESSRLPFRVGGSDHPGHIEARAELRDRETYYTELRLAVYGQSQAHPSAPAGPLIPAPRMPLDDQRPDTWTRTPRQVHPLDAASNTAEVNGAHRPQDESWDDLVARFGDTWT